MFAAQIASLTANNADALIECDRLIVSANDINQQPIPEEVLAQFNTPSKFNISSIILLRRLILLLVMFLSLSWMLFNNFNSIFV